MTIESVLGDRVTGFAGCSALIGTRLSRSTRSTSSGEEIRVVVSKSPSAFTNWNSAAMYTMFVPLGAVRRVKLERGSVTMVLLTNPFVTEIRRTPSESVVTDLMVMGTVPT